jgi:hypothetical protein
MKRLPLILLVSMTAFVLSCSKEFSEENGIPDPADSPVLIRHVYNDANTSLERLYEYNTGGRISNQRLEAISPGITATIGTFVARNATNSVNSANSIIISNFNPDGDTIRYQFAYTASGRIAYYLVTPLDPSFIGYDSVVCSYNAENKLVNQLVFLVPFDGTSPEPIQRLESSWVGNNMVSARSFALSGSTTGGVLEESSTFEFDNRPAALPITEDEFISGIALDAFGENNPIRVKREFPDTPSDNRTTEYKYTYGTNGRPATAVVTTIAVGFPNLVGTATYTYR